MKNLILASKSRDRKKLLEKIGLNFKIVVSEINEEKFKNKIEDAIKLVQELAKAKAEDVREKLLNEKMKPFIIIAADTLVEYEDKIIGKAKDKDEAFKILKSLSGNIHNLITGVAVINSEGKIKTDFDITEVTFMELADNEIRNYIQSHEWKGRAGCYSLNEKASLFTKEIIGSPSNVIGLPMHKLYRILKNDFNFDMIKGDIKN
jgi:septum formation protein